MNSGTRTLDEQSSSHVGDRGNPWLLVLSLVGVDYFSTLAYLPSMAVEAAGPLAPVAAASVVGATFLLALPVYWYVIGRSAEGRGATGMLEAAIPGWRGKLAVLTLLGFAAADFVITRSLSLADAAIHINANPRGRHLFQSLPQLVGDEHGLPAPIESLVRTLIDPQVAVTLALTLLSFLLWQVLKRGLTRRVLWVTACAVLAYLALTLFVIGSGLLHAWRAGALERGFAALFEEQERAPRHWTWLWLSLAAWTFPQMVLGLSGFEMIMTIAPQVRGPEVRERVRNTRKLMLVAAVIMSLYLLGAVTATTLLVPRTELLFGGAARHRSLAYLAHGSPLASGEPATAASPLFGPTFGDLFDASTILMLVLAGATVTMSLRNLLPHYLQRLGMEMSWAGRVGAILHVLNLIVLLVTVVFRASPSSQQWAYSTSVLVLLTAASLAASQDLVRRKSRVVWLVPAVAATFFLSMTGLTIFINHSGLTIALAFVAAILVSSFISRWIRSTELRFEGFDFMDEATTARWEELRHSGAKVLVPHRPGRISVAEKAASIQRDYRLDPATHVIFIEATLGDPSNFYQKPLMKIERDGALEVIRVSQCVSISHVLAAICLELSRGRGEPPEIVFGWSHESPLAANLNFLLLGEGNVPWMVKELVRKAMPAEARQPRIIIG
jgi:hypothetical protein